MNLKVELMWSNVGNRNFGKLLEEAGSEKLEDAFSPLLCARDLFPLNLLIDISGTTSRLMLVDHSFWSESKHLYCKVAKKIQIRILAKTGSNQAIFKSREPLVWKSWLTTHFVRKTNICIVKLQKFSYLANRKWLKLHFSQNRKKSGHL